MQDDGIRAQLRQRYATVASEPAGQFPYPVGRESARQLGYPDARLERIPTAVVERFVGVGNPYALGAPDAGNRIVDVGCGAGFDAQIAAQYVGANGRVIALDTSPAMLRVAASGCRAARLRNLALVEASAEALPVATGWADLLVSNGVLNLALDKAAAFAEVARVLRPGGRFQAADLVLVKELPADVRDDTFAWSN